MIGKAKKLKGKRIQYATCFIVCVLCFAFALVVKPIKKQHPMLLYSVGFSVLHFHVDDNEFIIQSNKTENNELIWTVKRKYFARFPADFVKEREKNVGIDRNTSFCLPGIQEVVQCSKYEFSVKEDLKSLFDKYPNSEKHLIIDQQDEKWSAVEHSKDDLEHYGFDYEKTITIALLTDFISASGLQRTKLRVLILVSGDFHSVSGGINIPTFSSNETSKSEPSEEKIKNLVKKYPQILSSSEELLTDLDYSTRSQPRMVYELKSYRGFADYNGFFIPYRRDKEYYGFFLPYYTGQILAALFLGCLGNFIGRKKILITVSISLILSKLLLIVPGSFNMIYAQKPLTGFGLGIFYIVVPIYICEIASDKIRGMLSSFLNLFLFLGARCRFLVDGSNVSHRLKPVLGYFHYSELISVILCVMFLTASYWLIETPSYFLLKHKTDEAKKASVKLRGHADDFELENPTNDDDLSNRENRWLKNLTPNFGTTKALLICCALVTIQFLSFSDFMENFSRGILKKYNYLLNTYNIFWIETSLGLTALVLVILLIDRAGRRFLLLASCMGMGFCSFNLIFMYFAVSYTSDNFELLECIYWLPVVSWAGFNFCFHLGIGSIPWILFSEIVNTKARGPTMAICLLISDVFLIMLQFDLIPTDHNYLPAIQAVNGALGALFVYFFVPETKGKSVEDILTELNRNEE